MSASGGPVLTTTRLSIERIQVDDIESVRAVLEDRCVMRYWPKPYRGGEVDEWVARQRQRYEDYGCGYWKAIEKATGSFVGFVGVIPHVFEGRDERSIGYIIARDHWRRGFAVEGARACVDWIFAAGFERATALIRPENGPSIAVARKLGLEPTRRITFWDLPHDIFAVTRKRWLDHSPAAG